MHSCVCIVHQVQYGNWVSIIQAAQRGELSALSTSGWSYYKVKDFTPVVLITVLVSILRNIKPQVNIWNNVKPKDYPEFLKKKSCLNNNNLLWQHGV